ncbi:MULTISPECIES: cyclase family protein [unclassified Paenibacillus]|uniref:cyclase family protein n=1 Tax=unclassified Paenibacillus TaxID=185978 RepID=UPI002404FA76|nr:MULTISPECIES: cyclase family protein [unclassified Paenibacillus]MDF9844283.1 kynurenine formamidase [Paenibacillus sp. PastF-2]MDF9850928.1 kynurenine formamidase [Paenibacillus sp. PastM-2]MDF9857458.1 kynurenine formamidase [Paenibacillus sp. PastF-1]MDH6482766.1 kynurenine formamidase [Paenibacillus sp. PastH-2]MDH6510192.1 kynurenine formamidase [Paenibacillus sp. PastM-3]
MGIQVIDLSQEIYQGMPVFPPHQKTMIFPNMSHEESIQKLGFAFATNNLVINEHGPTHSDAVYEYDPQGATIDEMPLEYFYGPAVCLDLSHISPDAYITRSDLQLALSKGYLHLDKGDIVLLYTGHYNRAYGTEEWLTRYTGLDYAAAEWLAQQGVVNIGIDAPSIDNPLDTTFAGHLICRKYKLTNTENLCNLDLIAQKRFLYFGLPLKIRKGTGSPIRAVAVFIE